MLYVLPITTCIVCIIVCSPIIPEDIYLNLSNHPICSELMLELFWQTNNYPYCALTSWVIRLMGAWTLISQFVLMPIGQEGKT